MTVYKDDTPEQILTIDELNFWLSSAPVSSQSWLVLKNNATLFGWFTNDVSPWNGQRPALIIKKI